MNACLLALCLSLGGGTEPPDRWLAEDKWKHFFTSFVATTLAASGARAAGMDARTSRAAGAGFGMGVGVWKEIHDHRTPGGHASVRDLVWDAAGVGAGVAVAARSR
jgi:uncharacterized protein YfiM (DUF2279 family)